MIVTLEPSRVAQVSIAVPPGATFVGLAPTTILGPLSGVVPTTTEACAVSPVNEVATAVYKVAVAGETFIFPLADPPEPPLMLTEIALVLFQLSGAAASAGFDGTVFSASRVSTSFAAPKPFALRYVFKRAK